MLRGIDRGLSLVSLVLAALLVVLLFTGPGWIGVGGSGSGSGSGGYGGGSSTHAQSGAALFRSAGCAGCHTLAAAQAHGTTGPDLDQKHPSDADVRSAVTSGPGAMPSYAGKLSRAQIAALARYVSSAAGH